MTEPLDRTSTTRMSEEVWNEWWINKTMRLMSVNHLRDDTRAYLHTVSVDIYKNIETSEFILDNFLEWDIEFQNFASNYFQDESAVRDIEILVQLMLRLDPKQHDNKFSNVDPHDFMDNLLLSRKLESPTQSLNTLRYRFDDFRRSKALASRLSFEILHELHGEEKFCQVLDSWIDNSISSSLHSVMLYADNWEEIKRYLKHYPSSWVHSVFITDPKAESY